MRSNKVNYIRACYVSHRGTRFGHLTHISDGLNKPICGNKQRNGGETQYPQWIESMLLPNCKNCLIEAERRNIV